MAKYGLDDILSVTTGKLVSRRYMDGIYDIMGFVMDDPYITTIGLAACQPVAAKELLRQHPQLNAVQAPLRFADAAHINDWLEAQETMFGKELEISPGPANLREEGDLDYLARVRGNTDNVVAVVVDGPAPTG